MIDNYIDSPELVFVTNNSP